MAYFLTFVDILAANYYQQFQHIKILCMAMIAESAKDKVAFILHVREGSLLLNLVCWSFIIGMERRTRFNYELIPGGSPP